MIRAIVTFGRRIGAAPRPPLFCNDLDYNWPATPAETANVFDMLGNAPFGPVIFSLTSQMPAGVSAGPLLPVLHPVCVIDPPVSRPKSALMVRQRSSRSFGVQKNGKAIKWGRMRYMPLRICSVSDGQASSLPNSTCYAARSKIAKLLSKGVRSQQSPGICRTSKRVE
jgi:hypothetical protein